MTTDFTLHPMLANDCIEIYDLPLCKVLLMNDSQYPWLILVPRKPALTEIYQLEWQQQQQFLNESSVVSELLMSMFDGDKLNVAAIGNLCPQLHIHHVVRRKTDASWPKPVWGQHPAIPYQQETLDVLVSKLQAKFAQIAP
ncbi:HIT domain-containing protein [Thalassotalea agarivorans]|uniref:Diadenosine tetraphosphate (Ap4A) hydrolase n=1 Tax=Thalassotalea agarivorans TaxID=349064 RepID=A0A1I0HIL8_THASX|nr:HIT domain-containing protein [Thalassotalea agarivorans]SET83770.1 Diadenosine tetraphosphate (Ap4A) hydrolase [Thalassotalea agarivorans]